MEDAARGEGKRWVMVAPKGGEARLLLAEGRGECRRTAIGNQTGGRVALRDGVPAFWKRTMSPATMPG